VMQAAEFRDIDHPVPFRRTHCSWSRYVRAGYFRLREKL
jgi:hypothetical protein